MGPLRRWLSLVLAGVLVLPACNGILDIDQTGIIVFEDVEASGPAAVPALVNGMVGNYQEAVDDVIRYSALLTDEMILSGTFETRLEVDRRRIQAKNATLAGAMYTPLHQARMQADTTVELLQNRLQDSAFEEVLDQLHEGIALGKLYGGFSRIWMAELYCWSILTGMFPESSPLMPDDRMSQALTFLQEAETQAAMAGLEEIRLAAIAGQARAHLWLRNFPQAAALAAAVPRDFVHWAEFSQNDPSQYNEMYMFTWGDIQAIRWTVGDGTRPTRGNERWEHFDEFISLNLLEFEPEGFTAFSSVFPVSLQGLYNRADSRVLMASGAEAMLIRAEAAVRSGQTATAELLLNDLRSDYSLRATVQWGVDPPDSGDELVDLTLAGTFTQDLRTVAAERARELWLTGDRLTTSRRLRLDPTVNIDLFPPVKTRISGGDDIAFPIVQLELDNNPNLGSGNACPGGQTIGSWR